MKKDEVDQRKEDTISRIKRLKQKQLTQDQYSNSRFKTAEDRRLNEFGKKEDKEKNNG